MPQHLKIYSFLFIITFGLTSCFEKQETKGYSVKLANGCMDLETLSKSLKGFERVRSGGIGVQLDENKVIFIEKEKVRFSIQKHECKYLVLKDYSAGEKIHHLHSELLKAVEYSTTVKNIKYETSTFKSANEL